MVDAAERHRELVADLTTQGLGLCELQVMGATGRSPTDHGGPGDLAD
jgi:hypothetical protein